MLMSTVGEPWEMVADSCFEDAHLFDGPVPAQCQEIYEALAPPHHGTEGDKGLSCGPGITWSRKSYPRAPRHRN